MLRSTAELAGLRIHATDGDIGSLANIYFDDIHWHVRYFVVDTGNWLPGRLVLVSPAAVENANVAARRLSVRLTKKQVEDSPGLEAHETVSRQHEQHVAKYYGWPVYWPAEGALAPDAEDAPPGDAHLRSAAEVQGYYVHAKDGDLGHVADYLIDDSDWEIRYLVVNTGKWLPGRKVIVDPRSTQTIDWAKSTVHLNLTKELLEHCPTYESTEQREREDQAHLTQHNQWPTYWY